MLAKIDGTHIAYSDNGAGTALVVLHAFPLNRTMWAPQEAHLSRRFRVVTVDLRGHGESDAPLWHSSLEQYAGDVNGLLDHLAIQQSVLIGLSMGGYVSFAFYRKYARRVQALVLADTRAAAAGSFPVERKPPPSGCGCESTQGPFPQTKRAGVTRFRMRATVPPARAFPPGPRAAA